MSMDQNVTYNGETLSDITTFALTQRIIKSPQKSEFRDLMNLDAIIQSVLFFNKIWVITPSDFGQKFKFILPDFLIELKKENILDIHTTEKYSEKGEFKRLFKDMKVTEKTLRKLQSKNKAISQDLVYYDDYSELSKHPGVKELLRSVGINDDRLIPLIANLVRTNVYLESKSEIESQCNSKITYSPHFIRGSLINQATKSAFERPIIINLIEKIQKIDQDQKNELNQEYPPLLNLELDVPILTTYVLTFCRDNKPQDIFDKILDMRTDYNVRLIRDWWIKFQEAALNPNFSDNFSDIKNYHRQMYEMINELGGKSHNANLMNIPQFDVTLLDSALFKISAPIDAAVTSYRHIMRWNQRRDLIFLVDLKNRISAVAQSRTEYERVFGKKFSPV